MVRSPSEVVQPPGISAVLGPDGDGDVLPDRRRGSLYAHDLRACSEKAKLAQTRASGAAEATAAQALQERRVTWRAWVVSGRDQSDSAPGSGSGKYRSWCIVRSESGIGFGIIIQYRTGNEGIRMDSSRKVLFTPRFVTTFGQ